MKAEINCDQKRRETMIANSRCIACNLSKKEQKIQKYSDEKKKKAFIQKVTGILYKYGDKESTPMLDKRIQGHL